MKRVKYIFGLLWIAVILSCSNTDDPFILKPSTSNAILSKAYDGPAIEKSLKHVAKVLARANTNKDVLRLLHQFIGKKFDGQNEVLFQQIFDKDLKAGKTFSACLREIRKTMKKDADEISGLSLDDVFDYLKIFMNLQIFMPYYDSWDGSTVPLVAYIPQGIDEESIKFIPAFDSQGKKVNIPVESASEYCYFVVGANERTDEYGELLTDLIFSREMLKSAVDENETIKSMDDIVLRKMSTRPDNYQLRFYRLGIYDDHEYYCLRGDPEISVKFSSPILGELTTYNFDHCFDLGYTLGDWIYFGYTVIWWHQDSYGPAIGFIVYERDGGISINLSLKYAIKTPIVGTLTGEIGFTIKDGDDELYKGYIGWYDPYPVEYKNTDARLMINSIP